MKTTTRMLKILLLLSVVILTSNQMIAQTLPDDAITQSVCIVIEDYEIVPSSNSTYAWSIIDQATGTPPPIGVADIIPTANDWYIQVDWTTPGTYELSVVETDTNGCSGAPVIVDVTVNPLDDATFTLTDYCEGSVNSATVTGTIGGVFTFTAPAPTGGETIDPGTGEITGGIAGTAYSVTYTTSTGICSQTSAQIVTINPLPTPGPIWHN
jgi:hypothetical protein